MATHSNILAWRIPWPEELAGYSPWGHKESDTVECLSTACVGICFVIPLIKQYVPKGETERYHSLGVLQSGLEE